MDKNINSIEQSCTPSLNNPPKDATRVDNLSQPANDSDECSELVTNAPSQTLNGSERVSKKAKRQRTKSLENLHSGLTTPKVQKVLDSLVIMKGPVAALAQAL
eukprot:GHVR01103083.1.p1 GENE.GHVR01103083.1~~GHVR01103083.1.p1  ORF type:complete len:103 (+),score=10.61 GHVR01103083.1:3-311(+)